MSRGGWIIVAFVAAIAFLGGLGWLVGAIRRWRWRRAGRRLGLSAHAASRSGTMSGTRDGRRVRAEYSITRRARRRPKSEGGDVRTSSHRTMLTTILAFGPPCFVLRPVGLLGRMAAAVSDQAEWELGDPEVQAAYDVLKPDEDWESVRAILRDAAVLDALRAGKGVGYDIECNARTLEMRRQGVELDPDALGTALDFLARLAGALDAAARAARVRSVERGNVWASVAQRLSGTLEADVPRVRARVRGVEVEVCSRLVSDERVTTFRVRVEQVPWTSLQVSQAQGGIAEMLNGDLEIGDPEIDAAFRIRGEPEDEVRDALLRSRVPLLDLATRGSLVVHDRAIELQQPDAPVDADDLEQTTLALADLLRTLARLDTGPFR